MSSARFTPLADLLRRLCAAGCAALVLALTIFAASPGAHDSLHADGTARTDDGCAVVLFAGGVALPLEAPTLVPPAIVAREIVAARAGDIFLVSPRYLRQPERGPPGRV
jgi:hypothetical protein